jgi:hypothetical protein
MAFATEFGDWYTEEGVQGFELGLEEQGDEGGHFRTENDPRTPLQRKNLTERKGPVDIRCTGKDVIHGYVKDGEDLVTLVVYDFQFVARKSARRIAQVDIEFTYESKDGETPKVLKIAPEGLMTLAPASQTETVTKGGEATAGVNVFGIDLGGSWKWEKAVSMETRDSTSIYGSIDLPAYRNYGEPNTASWTLMENKSRPTGVPTHFRTAVLLGRRDDEEFQATFKIKAEVDLLGKFARLFGKTPKDDPVRYEPSLPPTNKLRHYDTDNLNTVNLNEIARAAFRMGEL